MFGPPYLHVGNDLRSRQRAVRCAKDKVVRGMWAGLAWPVALGHASAGNRRGRHAALISRRQVRTV